MERAGKGTWLTYTFAASGDYSLTIHPIPGTQTVNGRELLMEFSGQKLKLERQ